MHFLTSDSPFITDPIVNRVLHRLPLLVCGSLPTIETISNRDINMLLANFRQAWGSARLYGMTTLRLQDGQLYFERGCNVNSDRDGFTVYGSVHWRSIFQRLNQNQRNRFGYSIVSHELWCAIETYRKMIAAIDKRFKDYGTMLSTDVSFTDTANRDVRQETIDDFGAEHFILAPKGSTLSNIASSVADFDKVIQPFKERINVESDLPGWLLWDEEGLNDTTAEGRANYLSTLFCAEVLPFLYWYFDRVNKLVDIIPPTYRDRKYSEEVRNISADTLYKESSAKRADTLSFVTVEKLKLERQGLATTTDKISQGRVL